MEKIVIAGGNRLEGEIKVNGAKNAVLPILAATILNGGRNIIHNCPDLKDVSASLQILAYIGCKVERQGTTIIVDSSNIKDYHIPEHLMREMRSSVIFLGSIISRCRKAVLSYPGGCEIGPRPIDLHLKSLRQLQIKINEAHGYIYCDANKIEANDINLNFPSVGATENLMLAAVMAEGTTIVRNVAKEPEIIDLQDYLNAMGAKISGAGTSVIKIEGVSKLHDVEHTVIPDRIVASTYLSAAAITGGDIKITNVNAEHIQAVLAAFKECGCKIYIEEDSIALSRTSKLQPVDVIRTLPHPGFPTDMQAPMMSVLTLANGTSIISETIFENRFKHVEELMRMGADIMVDGRVAVIRGVPKLTGASVNAMDLRGGAALVIAGLAAEGMTTIECIHHIDRGYEKIEEKLRTLGADIKRVN
ncbi:UDP-N-acetylglucosamine 1-carboxyvinyltransferase [Petroclostridium sp. X23]|uniref:UDP-N-acetylglucosamine 1-carboxyvinyltransferase n=1 Tax=Petroclostridium sp. X23 TaxID=3045146 RepID=UPI0024ACAFF2|nr:UDP-N-acetylglucosamine 1-carboxyvinyltransferase [Petroclostridium sp. X23]WHH58893.1 UDP-N-acetylglucosamine 1-carboxyvinyltransferase [Petroclostridium sp. X23]